MDLPTESENKITHIISFSSIVRLKKISQTQSQYTDISNNTSATCKIYTASASSHMQPTCTLTHYTHLIATCERRTFSAASWSSSVRSSVVTSDVRGRLKDWMLVSPGFFIVTIAQSFANDNCVCHHNNVSPLKKHIREDVTCLRGNMYVCKDEKDWWRHLANVNEAQWCYRRFCDEKYLNKTRPKSKILVARSTFPKMS